MGDSRRFIALADFITKNFKPGYVADVAGGTGQLSYWLTLRGFDCTVIDPRKTNLPHDVRLQALHSKQSIRRLRQRFTPDMAAPYSLIVGLHPDQATEAICQCAPRGLAVVVVPCCNYWRGLENHGSPSLAETIRRYWRQQHVEWWETQLSINGKNLVFVANA